MCKLLIVALLVPYNVYGVDSIENLVDKKIEISMSAPAVMPSVPVGAFKLMLKAVRKVGKELPYKELSELLNISMKTLREMSNEKVLEKTLIQDMRLLNIKIAKNIDLSLIGYRAIELSNKLGDDILETHQNAKDLYLLIQDGYYYKAIEILEENPTIKLEELASQVKAKIVAESNKKINLGFTKSKKTRYSNINIFTDDVKNIREELEKAKKVLAEMDERPENIKMVDIDDNRTRFQKEKYNKLIKEKDEKIVAEINYYIGLQYEYGDYGMYELDMSRRYEEASRWYEKASESGHINATYRLAEIINSGKGNGSQDLEKLYTTVSENGTGLEQKLAKHRLGLIYTTGNGKEQDFTKAYELFRESFSENKIEPKIVEPKKAQEVVPYSLRNSDNAFLTGGINAVNKPKRNFYSVDYKIEVLKDYLKKGNKLTIGKGGKWITYEYKGKEYPIGAWIKGFRSDHVMVTPVQRKALEDLNIYDTPTYSVDFKIKVLQDYLEKGNEIIIIKNGKHITYTYEGKEYPIGAWISGFRTDHVIITSVQRKALESLKIYDSLSYSVDLKIEVLKDYIKNGHKLKTQKDGKHIAYTYKEEEYPIGRWIDHFRSNRLKLTPAQRKILEDLKIYEMWQAESISYSKQIDELIKYKKQGGEFDARGISLEVEGQNRKLREIKGTINIGLPFGQLSVNEMMTLFMEGFTFLTRGERVKVSLIEVFTKKITKEELEKVVLDPLFKNAKQNDLTIVKVEFKNLETGKTTLREDIIWKEHLPILKRLGEYENLNKAQSAFETGKMIKEDVIIKPTETSPVPAASVSKGYRVEIIETIKINEVNEKSKTIVIAKDKETLQKVIKRYKGKKKSKIGRIVDVKSGKEVLIKDILQKPKKVADVSNSDVLPVNLEKQVNKGGEKPTVKKPDFRDPITINTNPPVFPTPTNKAELIELVQKIKELQPVDLELDLDDLMKSLIDAISKDFPFWRDLNLMLVGSKSGKVKYNPMGRGICLYPEKFNLFEKNIIKDWNIDNFLINIMTKGYGKDLIKVRDNSRIWGSTEIMEFGKIFALKSMNYRGVLSGVPIVTIHNSPHSAWTRNIGEFNPPMATYAIIKDPEVGGKFVKVADDLSHLAE